MFTYQGKSEHITYRSGYKYQLKNNAYCKTGILGYNINHEFILLNPNGELCVKCGYAWDGASGPTIDGKTNMRASLFHDAKYQLIDEKLLPITIKDIADEELRRDMVEDGAFRIRAWYYYQAVKRLGGRTLGNSETDIDRIAP